MEHLSKVGSTRFRRWSVQSACHVILDSQGNVIVNDRGTDRVQKFDPNGKFLLKFGSMGKGDGQFTEVEHMTTDKFNNIYVNDHSLALMEAACHASKSSIPTGILLQNLDHWDRETANL